jgi:hypothetical protein
MTVEYDGRSAAGKLVGARVWGPIPCCCGSTASASSTPLTRSQTARRRRYFMSLRSEPQTAPETEALRELAAFPQVEALYGRG